MFFSKGPFGRQERRRIAEFRDQSNLEPVSAYIQTSLLA
jgi:hypothetical protein